MKVKDLKAELQRALTLCEQQDEEREIQVFAWCDQDEYTIVYEQKHVVFFTAQATAEAFDE